MCCPRSKSPAGRGMMTGLPYIAQRGDPMHFRRWLPGDPMAASPYHFKQPADDAPEIRPDLILAPLLGFDRAGNRLGQGGGFYDRAFAAYPQAMRIGIAWSIQEVDALPVESWDQSLHAVITEKEWIDFR